MILKEGEKIIRIVDGKVWELAKDKHKQNHWYFKREDEKGLFRTPSASEDIIKQTIKDECKPNLEMKVKQKPKRVKIAN